RFSFALYDSSRVLSTRSRWPAWVSCGLAGPLYFQRMSPVSGFMAATPWMNAWISWSFGQQIGWPSGLNWMSGVLNCWFQTTCRFWTLLELICLSVEKREFDSSPSPLTQLAPAGVTLEGNHDTDEPFRDADASATTVVPRTTAAMARSGNLRMRPIPPLDCRTTPSSESIPSGCGD